MDDIAFSFGIITNAENGINNHLIQAVHSIKKLNIPEYEIIIVGNKNNIVNHEILKENNELIVIDFNENIKNGWITKKKNEITKIAKYENIVYQHDYIVHDKNWYNGFKEYGDNFKACMTQIRNADDTRFRDWVLFPYFACSPYSIGVKAKKLWEYANIQNNESMIPYDENRLNKFQYFSGSYWIAKKNIMLEIPLDENLCHEQGEDVLWSFQYSSKYNFSMNKFSTIRFLKQKQDAFSLIRNECLDKCIDFVNKYE